MDVVKNISYKLTNTSLTNSHYGLHILHSIPLMVAYVDADLCLQYLNPASEKFLGTTTGSVRGKSIFEVLGKELMGQMPDELNGSLVRFEAEISLNGTKHVLELTLNPDVQEEESIKGYAVIINDITAARSHIDPAQSVHELEDYLDNVRAPLHKVDSRGLIVWANKAELDLLGYSAHEYIGHNIREFHADQNAISDILERLSRNEQLDRYEALLKCKDGSLRNVVISSNVYLEKGKFVYTRCFTVDVTEEKKLFDTLYESEQHFRTLIDGLSLPFYTVDKNGYVDLYNKAAVELWGRTPKKGEDKWCGSYRVYKLDGSIFPPEDLPMALTFKEGKRPSTKQTIIIERPDGMRRHVLPHAEPIFDSAGNVVGAVNMLADITDLVNTEKALRESEHLYRQLIEKLPIAIYTCDADGYIQLYNKAATDLWGREPMPGKDMWCGSWRIYQDDGSLLPLDRCPMAIALKEARSVYGEEINIERPDGTRSHVMPYPQPVLNSAGQVIGAVNVLLDITDRKKAEENNARLAAIVQSSDDAIISKTLESVVTSWNKSAERMFGYTAEEMIGESITKLIPPERLDEEPKIIERLQKGERVDHFETERVAKDGRRLNISLSISPVRDNKGNIMGAAKIARDITQQKKLLEALQESEERFRYVADTAPVMIWMTNQSGQFTFLNKRWVEFRSDPIERDVRKYFERWLHPDDIQKTIKLFDESFERQMKFELECRVRRSDGEYRWISTCGLPRYAPDDTFLGYIGSSIDIHEQKETRQELEKLVAERTSALNQANFNLQKSNEELERFAYVASHDLQEPLRKIQAFGNLLMERSLHELSPNGQGYVNRMINAASRMQNLIEALLEFSRATLIEKTFEKRDLNVIIDDVRKEFQDIMDDKLAVIEVAELPRLTIIPFQFKQMMSNMISNALKYAKPDEKPVIKISSSILKGEDLSHPDANKEIQYCRITVQDNGIGFENEHAQRIFELFQRLHGRNEYTGSGIGLSICKKIAENHDGFIRAESESGKGAAFHIFIPLR